MKTGALVLGIIGGLLALLIGQLGYGLGIIADLDNSGSGAPFKAISIGLPVAALVGAGMVKAKPLIGAGLLAVSAISLVLLLGFNFLSLIPVVLLGVAALLGFLGAQESDKQQPQT